MDYIAYILIAPIACIIITISFVTMWPFRGEQVTRPLLWYMGFVFVLLVFNYLELLAPSPELTLLFAKIQHISNLFFPISWVVFAFSYAGLEHLILRRIHLLYLVIPIVGIIAAFTNEYHGLFWKDIDFFTVEGFLTMRGSYGPIFWISGVSSYFLIFLGSIIILIWFFNGPALFRRQSFWILTGVFSPLIFNLLYVFRVFPFLRKDYTPVSFALAGMCFFFGIYWNRLLRLLPIARGHILQALQEGVLVWDSDYRLVDYNNAARDYLNIDVDTMGKGIDELKISGLNREVLQQSETSVLEVPIRGYTFRIRRNEIADAKGKSIGYLLTIVDISEEKKLIQELNITQVLLRRQETLAAIGQIAGGIAHEINNPLSYLSSGYRTITKILLPFLEESTMQDDQKEMIKAILMDSQEGFHHMEKVVRNMLNLSRKDTKTSVEFSAREYLMKAVNLLKIEYTFQYVENDSLALKIIGNPESFLQIAMNLMRNGIQAWQQEPRGDSPELSTKVYTQKNLLVIDFQNNGPPLTENEGKKIFEPLYTTKTDGNGFGLSIARDLAATFPGGKLAIVSHDPVCFRFSMTANQ